MRYGSVVLFLVTAVVAGCQHGERKAGKEVSCAVIPSALHCEYAVNPLGVDVAQPRLDWQLEPACVEARGVAQTAYEVQVASSEARLSRGDADMWATAKVASAQSVGLRYAGRALAPGERVYWRVRVWDSQDRPSEFSDPAWWEMGLLAQENWRAQWIQSPTPLPENDEAFFSDHPAPLFRKSFALSGKVARARAYVSGLGYYEFRLNGKNVGDEELEPAWTAFGKRVFYSVHDVTALLNEGENAAGLLVGNGWYNPLPLRMWNRFNLRDALTVGPPRAIVQIEVEYADGRREQIVTDETWKTAPSAILRNSVYLGEVCDARLEQPGWSAPGFDDAAWAGAVKAEQTLGLLEARPLPPIRVTETIKPVNVSEPTPGVFVFDMGVNFAGRVRLRCEGPAGTCVQMRYGELLHPDGTLNPMTTVAGQNKNFPISEGSERPSTAWARDVYILRGGAPEEYAPQFAFHGFRYVEVTGFPDRPTVDAITGERLHTDLEPAGDFACSNDLLNRIHRMCENTFLSNLLSVQSDCPGREKFGYGGDIVATSDALICSLDMVAFYRKTVRDFADAVRPNGGFTETSPFLGIADESLGGDSGPIGWGTAHPLLLNEMLQYYGDRVLLEEQYAALKKWIEFLESCADKNILDNGLGDHETIAPKEIELSGTAFYFYNASLAARVAQALGKTDDVARFEALAKSIRGAFNKRFLNAESGQFGTGTQANQAFALSLGLAPERARESALGALVSDIEANKKHLTTGIFGTKYMLDALSRFGRADLAFDIVTAPGLPGWANMLDQGATTLWEHWDYSDNTFSHNHPMFGSVNEWLFAWVAGIRPDDAAVGFDRIVFQPQPVGDLTWAKAEYQSIRGPVASAWEKAPGRFELKITVPVGATATVHIPTCKTARILEGDMPAEQAPGIALVARDDTHAVCSVASGTYHFASVE